MTRQASIRTIFRRLIDLLSAALVLGIVLIATVWFSQLNQENFYGNFKVVDGDTLLSNGQKLRLIGIDAPEYRQKCQIEGSNWSCGRKATTVLQNLVGSAFNLVCNGQGIDKYERPLVKCVDGNTDINAQMVRQGYAVAYGGYFAEERDARKKLKGIWRGDFIQPQEWRRLNHGDAIGTSGNAFFENAWARVKAAMASFSVFLDAK